MNKTDNTFVYKLCRTCLSESYNTKMLEDTISLAGASVSISHIIMACASVEIVKEDALPNIICSLCVEFALASYRFRKRCEESDKVLRLRMIKSEIEFDGLLVARPDIITSNEIIIFPKENSCKTRNKINSDITSNHHSDIGILNKTEKDFIDYNNSIDYHDDYNDIDYMDDMPLIVLKREIDAMPRDIKTSMQCKKTADTAYSCTKCYSIFLNENHLRSHFCQKYGKRRKCIECAAKFDNLSELREHYSTHEVFICKNCDKSFDTMPKLKKHIENYCANQVGYRKTCAICQTEFESYKKLKEHLKTHDKITCLYCKKVFPRLLGLQQHLKRFHRQKMKNQSGEKKLCRVCHLEFDNTDQLRDHYTSHDSFPCTTCAKVFRSISSLRSHQHRACINSDKKACMVCNSQFSTHYQLLKHYTTDHEIYPCTKCGESFEKVLDLRIHKQRKCRQSQTVTKCILCEMEFVSLEQLLQHHTSHPQPIQCPSCDQAFPTMRAFSRHCKNNRCKTQPSNQNRIHSKRNEETNTPRCAYCGWTPLAVDETNEKNADDVANGTAVEEVDMKRHVEEHEVEGLRCKHCESTFNTMSSWKEHNSTHISHDCPECTQTFDDSNSLQIHTLRHYFDSIQQTKSTQCRECELSFDDRHLLFEHYITHTTFSCPTCEKSYDGLRDMQEHYTKETCHKPKLPRTCDICHKVFRRAYAMRLHRLTHNSNVLCPHCDFQADRRPDLYQHMDSEHANLKTIQCPDCDKRFFKKTNLMVHKLVHTGEKKHICDYCGVGFALGNNLKAHIRIHTGERPYKCKVCDKTFVQHRSMVSHMDMHLPRQKHVCPICGKTYPRKQAMKLHMKRHNEDRPFTCTLCAKTFQTKLDLKRHTETHSGIRNHVCNVCSKAFGRKNALNVHMMIHTGETPHVCDICGKGFIQAHCLRGHMKTHHGRV